MMLIEHAIARLAGLEAQAWELRAEIAQSHVGGFVDHLAALGPTWMLARQTVNSVPVKDVRDMLAEALRQLAKHKNDGAKLAVTIGGVGGKGVAGAMGYPGAGGVAGGGGGRYSGGSGGGYSGADSSTGAVQGGAGGGAVQSPNA